MRRKAKRAADQAITKANGHLFTIIWLIAGTVALLVTFLIVLTTNF